MTLPATDSSVSSLVRLFSGDSAYIYTGGNVVTSSDGSAYEPGRRASTGPHGRPGLEGILHRAVRWQVGEFRRRPHRCAEHRRQARQRDDDVLCSGRPRVAALPRPADAVHRGRNRGRQFSTGSYGVLRHARLEPDGQLQPQARQLDRSKAQPRTGAYVSANAPPNQTTKGLYTSGSFVLGAEWHGVSLYDPFHDVWEPWDESRTATHGVPRLPLRAVAGAESIHRRGQHRARTRP